MSRRPAAAVSLVATLLATVLLSGCSGLEGTDDANYVTPDGTIRQIDVGDRDDPVDIAGTTLDDEPLDLADLRGQVVVLNVWASWCNPCRAEAPVLAAVSKEIDAEFVGLLFKDENIAAARRFEEKYGIAYPTMVDEGQVLQLDLRAPPSTFILDTEGRVAAVITGAIRSGSTLEDLVTEIAGEDATEDGPVDG